MNKNEALEILNGITYRPGWGFTAHPIPSWEGPLMGGDASTDIAFVMACETVNTDRDCAERGYPEAKTLDWEIPISSSKIADGDELIAGIFQMLMLIELHESREFFRLKTEDMQAPFHPHREDGNKRWSAAGL